MILELLVGGFVLVDRADDSVARVDVFVFEENSLYERKLWVSWIVHLILELLVGWFVLVDGADDSVAGVNVFVFEESSLHERKLKVS